MKWSFSYNAFVIMSFYNVFHITQSITKDPKHSAIKELHYKR